MPVLLLFVQNKRDLWKQECWVTTACQNIFLVFFFFLIICVRIYISCFYVMFQFLMIAVMHSRTLYLDCFLKVGIRKIEYCTLWDCKKNVIHSKNCHCNDVDPGGKPGEIEDLPFALSAQGLQVREKNERAFEMLFLACSVVCYTGSFLLQEAVSGEGAQEPHRCSQGYLLCSHSGTPQIWCQCGT